MNKGLNIFLVILLCVVLYIGLLMSFYSSDNSDSWNSQQGYTMPMGGKSSTSAVSVGVGSASTGVAVPMRSVSRSMRPSRAVSLYAPAQHSSVANTQYPIGGTPSNSVASPLYTTSSATMKSFGGGSNGAVSVSGGAVQSSSRGASQVSSFWSYGNGVNPPLAMSSSHSSLGTFPLGNMHGANFLSLGNSHVDVSYGYQGIGNTTINGPRTVRGRLNVGPPTNTNGWLNWLVLNGYGTKGADGVWGLDVYELRRAYDDYVDAWNPTMGGDGPPTWDEWLSWFMESEEDPYGWTDDGGDTYTYYKFIPVGGLLPLLLFALLYVLIIFIRSKTISNHVE